MDQRILLTLLILSIALSVSGCTDASHIERIERTRVMMNTDVTITVMHPDTSEAESAIDCAFAEMYGIEHLMSHTAEESEVARLNDNGFLVDASQRLCYVIAKSFECSELSNGSFDITVLPVIDLWKSKIRAGSPPTSEEINETLRLINYKNISIKNNSVYFSHRSMQVTLGGVAKGYAVDRAIGVLQEHSICHALVNAGGDIRAMGFRREDDPWRVALRNPSDKTEHITVMNLEDMSVATSGNYERYFSEEARASHIIDPKTGYAADDLLSATIIAENATDADALATAVFVLGEKDGMDLIERLDGVEGLIITADRRILRSSGFGGFEEAG
ncbi:MAG TPA: FAD:protein FMN transferase, partial [Methanosarcinales archaeon]|nr:FAD:protein FMN transferase [Methanosarcinales archaeon]